MIRIRPSLILEITDACNLKCPFCYEDIRRRKGHIGLDTFATVLSSVRPLYLQITGGEPTVHPEFRELLRTALKRVPVVQMVTNGTRLDEEADFLAGLRRKPFIGISLDDPRLRRRKANDPNHFRPMNIYSIGRGSPSRGMTQAGLYSRSGVLSPHLTVTVMGQ